MPLSPPRTSRRATAHPDGGDRTDEIRSTMDRAKSGAPAAGHAVRDFFSTDEIFQRLVATADEEFVRSNRLLFLSGLAAGLSIGLTLMARSAATAAVPGDPSGLVGNLLYPIGFLLIVLGRYQLFTENTLTPVTLVLTRIAAIPQLLRVWGVVLVANVLGAAIVAFMLAETGVLDADSAEAARSFGLHGIETAWGPLFWKAVIAGWLVASMVWLNHAARDTVSRFFIVFFIMFIIPSADLFHCITGACEVFFLMFQGEAGLGDFGHFFSAVVLGNTVGGVLLVAILNNAQTRERRFPDRDCGELTLTWREFLFGLEPGEAQKAAPPADAPDRAVEEESMLDRPIPVPETTPHG
jgi:formate/nitrite transporter FocA (FNT family)